MSERKDEKESTLRSCDDAADGTISARRRERKLQPVRCKGRRRERGGRSSREKGGRNLNQPASKKGR